MTGFYPRQKRVFVAKLNTKTGKHDVIDTRDGTVRCEVGNGKDARKQASLCNFRFGVEK